MCQACGIEAHHCGSPAATRPTPRKALGRTDRRRSSYLPTIVPGTLLGEVYRIEHLLSQTVLASVYLAVDLQLERRVAVKIVAGRHASDLGVAAAFHREAVVMARVRHAHVVQIYTFGRHRGSPFLVMEYMPGGTVAGAIEALGRRGERVETRRALAMLDQAALGLAAVHEQGIVHGDVKPANMLLDARDSVSIADFGLVRALSPLSATAAAADSSRTVSIVGTPLYIAPEVILGAASASELHLCDVYSLGVSAFELLAGRGPFVSGTIEAILKQHLLEAPPRITALRPDLPAALDRVLARALSKRPRQRYPSCVELAGAVRYAALDNAA